MCTINRRPDGKLELKIIDATGKSETKVFDDLAELVNYLKEQQI